MGRYLRLYGYFVRFSFSRAMEFRVDFFFRVIMDFLFYLVHIAFFKVIFLHTPSLAGWSEPAVMIFLCGYFIMDAVHMTVFSNNMWMLPQAVNKGDLDYHLTRPVSSLFFVSFRDFAANSFLNLILAFGFFAWAIVRYPDPMPAWKILLYLGALIPASLLHYMLRLLFTLPVFWTHSGRGFQHISWKLDNLAEQPDRIYTGWTRRVLVSILPMAIIVSFPARLMLEPFSWSVLGHLLGVTLAFFAVLLFCWDLALKNYSSASS